MTVTDLSAFRTRFPALARRIDGRPCVFVDAPGGSQVPDVVIDAMRGYLTSSNSNTHGTFATSEGTDALIAEARRAAADLIGATPGGIVFGQNATSLLLSLSRSFGRTLSRRDEVVVTRLDHDANIRPWLLAARDAGATVRWVDIRTDDATLDLDSLDEALGDRTRLVAVTLASNAVGTITPAAEVIRRAHAVGALAAVDGVHLAQHRSIDVSALDADIAVISPYKIFGPHLGVLWARDELLRTWEPYKVRPASDDVPERWETGTLNHEGLAGFVASVGYLEELGAVDGSTEPNDRRTRLRAAFAAIAAWERVIADRFLAGVSSDERIATFGITDRERLDERTPTFALRIEGERPIETTRRLGERGIFAWDGHYYALELMERLGLEPDLGGAVRIGFCHYSSFDEVDGVLSELPAPT